VGAGITLPSDEHSPVLEHCRDDGGFLGIGAVPKLEALHVVEVTVVGRHIL
jgi:hypothetical protein